MAELVEITDPADPRLGDYRDLRDVELRKHLEAEHGLFLAEGEKVVRRAVEAGYHPRSFLMAPRWLDGLADVLDRSDAPCYVLSEDLAEQVTGFQMAGEMLGLDGIGSGRYNGNAVALEDSEVCVLPFAMIEELGREVPAIQRNLHTVLSREIVRDHGVMMLLGSMSAEERLAAFLINLSRRFTARGYSSSDFYLRMTREEIGSYLGLKLETVSRSEEHTSELQSH